MYPTQSRSDEDVKILIAEWCAILAHTQEEALELAIAEYKASSETFLPVPGKLRERAAELSGNAPQSKAEKAWQDFIDCDYGRDKRYMTDGIMLRCVRELGGFDAIGSTESDKMHFVKTRFIEKYCEYTRRDNAFQALPAGTRERVMLALGAGQ